jgi:putative two-component system hydrogenase maturation factor HypX/HoxX
MRHRLPMTAPEAVKLGFYDACLPGPGFRRCRPPGRRTGGGAGLLPSNWPPSARSARRRGGQAAGRLSSAEELTEMRRNFYGFDPSYHVARYHFVSRSPHSWTPRHLARHRDLDWKVPA